MAYSPPDGLLASCDLTAISLMRVASTPSCTAPVPRAEREEPGAQSQGVHRGLKRAAQWESSISIVAAVCLTSCRIEVSG